MKIYYDINEYAAMRAASGTHTSVALGCFDGVHEGHRAVISRCCEAVRPLESVVLTFAESPAAALGRERPAALTDNSRKAELIAEIGADALIFADFTQLKDMSAEDFVRHILREKLGAERVVCGYNYRFGKGGSGDTAALAGYCSALGITAEVVEPVHIDGAPVSSTRIRALLGEGEIARANRLLGYRYGIRGSIASGNRLGTAMGLPTVNLPIAEGMQAPRLGVYSSAIRLGDKEYAGATNIGVHPTVGENPSPLCETFIIDFDGSEVYGVEAVCELGRFIRPEKKFASADELTAQIKRDIEAVKTLILISNKTVK